MSLYSVTIVTLQCDNKQAETGKTYKDTKIIREKQVWVTNNEHIEPRRVNQFFLLKYSYPTNNGDKRKGTNSENHYSSPQVLEAGIEKIQHKRNN